MAKQPEDDYIDGYEARWRRGLGAVMIAVLLVIGTGYLAPDSKGGLKEFALLCFLAFLTCRVGAAVIAGLRRKRLRGRLAGGLCVVCGYDLRASGGKCPECGTSKNGA